VQRLVRWVGDAEIVRELLTSGDDAKIVLPFIKNALEFRPEDGGADEEKAKDQTVPQHKISPCWKVSSRVGLARDGLEKNRRAEGTIIYEAHHGTGQSALAGIGGCVIASTTTFLASREISAWRALCDSSFDYNSEDFRDRQNPDDTHNTIGSNEQIRATTKKDFSWVGPGSPTIEKPPARVAKPYSRSQFHNALGDSCAKTATTIDIAPRDFKTRAASFAVAPVVRTSSTRMTVLPAKSSFFDTANAPRTFTRRSAGVHRD